MTFQKWLRDALERVLSTILQTALPFLGAAMASDQEWWRGLVAVLFPAVGTTILAVLSATFPPIKSYVLDVVFRLVRTILAVVAGAWAADNFDVLNMTGWRAIGVSVGTAVFVFVKAEIARRKANTITPASFAKAA